MGKVIGGKFSQIADIAAKNDESKKKSAQREQERNPFNEKPYGRMLNMLGRYAYQKEYFEGIKLENQTFPVINGIDDVTKTVNFVNGYTSEIAHIEHAKSQGYLDEVENQYKNRKTK